MKNSVPLVAVICIMACVFRGLCESMPTQSSEFVSLVMAFINCFALFFVIYLIIHNAFGNIESIISGWALETEKTLSIINVVRIVFNIVILLVLGISGIIYMKNYTTLSNDILSIIALGLSIITDDISGSIASVCVGRIRKKFLS